MFMHLPLLPLLAIGLFSGMAIKAQEGFPILPRPSPVVDSPAADTIATPVTETIVLIRHGEKPADDKGQLTCRGLNRALALPKVLVTKFGPAEYVFAPLTVARESHGKSYCYIRPLMTIEPTAFMLGLPVDTRFPENDIDAVQKELTEPTYRRALVFVAWEHKNLVLLVRHLLSALGDTADRVPEWASDDYDHIYIVKIRTEATGRIASFTEDREMLDGLSDVCPAVSVPVVGAH